MRSQCSFCCGQSETVRRFLAVADGVVLIGAVAGGDSSALADRIHGAVVTGNDAAANFVLLEVEVVMVWFPMVGDSMDGAADCRQ